MFIDYPIAVIGAGIIGAAIAARLTSLGISVVLIDKGAAGSLGASSYSGGLVRLYDRDPLLMELAAMSIGLLDQEPFASAYASALQRTGAIYRAAPDQLECLHAAIKQHASARYPMQLLSGGEPGFSAHRSNLFEPHASVGNVRQAVAALAGRVRRDGLLLEHCEVKSLDCRSCDEVLLDIGQATLRCRAVVVAAGAWSQRWLPPLGLHTRSIPLARVRTDDEWAMPVIDAVTQSYAIPLSRNLVQTGCGFRDTAPWPQDLKSPDARHAEDARVRIEQLSRSGCEPCGSGFSREAARPATADIAPVVRVGGTTRHQVLDLLPGFDSYTPDGRPVVGFCAEDSPLYVATGMSGLGFKFAPAVAQIAAGQLQRHLNGQAPGADWSGLSPSRLMQVTGQARMQP